MARGPPRAGASRSRSERAHARRNNRGDRWDRWEPFGSNRGGKGAPRGEPPPLWAGPDGAGPWRHDLFETEVQADRTSARPDVARWAAEPWLPPRGLGSGRSAGRRASGGGRAVAVWNLDISVTERDLASLFARVGRVLRAWVDSGQHGNGRGGVEFECAEEAAQAVRRYHRHPWKGSRPINVAVQHSAIK
mmetsp:Transcript_91124/g.253728  ORF Transcript_91124/g.253728 Transcript_91124/m.253728 type:complete len:191 (-) Transcript_91124:199-771(-)